MEPAFSSFFKKMIFPVDIGKTLCIMIVNIVHIEVPQ